AFHTSGWPSARRPFDQINTWTRRGHSRSGVAADSHCTEERSRRRPCILSVGNMSGISSDLVDSRHLRRSVGQFVTGVTVVTYDLDGSPRGVTLTSFSSVSVAPPLILVSIARKARAAAGLSGSRMVVNVLAADQLDLARHFAGQRQGDLEIPWSRHHRPPPL